MFEKKYKEAFDQIQPSEALQQETLELMKEAQNHRPATEPPRKTWKLAYTVSLASTAAAIMICVISASFWLGQGKKFEEAEGEWDVIGENDSTFTEDQQDDKDKNITDPGESDDTSKNHEAPSSSAPKDDENANNSLKSDSESDVVGDESESDPNAPVVIDTADTKTYLSLGAFLNAIDAMETPGFGTDYLNSKELLLLPASLPEGARFRCLYLETESGNYTYSYLLESGHYLEIKVNADLPRTADALTALQQSLPAEYTLKKSGNQRTYTFGDFAEMSVSLLPIGNADLPDETAADALLKTFEPALYTGNNPYLDLTY